VAERDLAQRCSADLPWSVRTSVLRSRTHVTCCANARRTARVVLCGLCHVVRTWLWAARRSVLCARNDATYNRFTSRSAAGYRAPAATSSKATCMFPLRDAHSSGV
jgi:hypothetical protein